VGAQCLATQIAGNYTISRPGRDDGDLSRHRSHRPWQSPKLTFKMWVDTEGATYDGFNLQISTDGGMNYAILNTVMPPYPLTVGGKPAWGGHQSALGWQDVEANLAPYAGQTSACASPSRATLPAISRRLHRRHPHQLRRLPCAARRAPQHA
jgi:hypothetical protein